MSVRAPATGMKDDALTVEARHLNNDRAVQVVEMTDLALTEQDFGPVAGAICGEHDVRLPSGYEKKQWRSCRLSQVVCQTERMLRNVVAYVQDDAGTFGVGVASEIFGCDRSADGLPAYDFDICSLQPGKVRTDTGLVVNVEHGIDRCSQADLIIILGWDDFDKWPPEPLLAALRSAVARGATVVSHCSGAFVLAAAGLLDGKRATTHWQYAARMAELFPEVRVDPGVLYVDEGQILTSAGTAAGIDVCLYLIRREQGARVANAIARRMVVPAHRDGGQAQYVEAPLPDVDDNSHLIDVLDWARANLADELSVDALAARALTSPRSFARHFRAATGTTPHAWVLSQRMARAEELLEAGDLPVEEVARRSGFGTAAAMRMQFARRRGVPPRSYRRTFRRTDLPA